MARNFQVKEGKSIQHENKSYAEGSLVPFDSDAIELALFHAPNIELVPESEPATTTHFTVVDGELIPDIQIPINEQGDYVPEE